MKRFAKGVINFSFTVTFVLAIAFSAYRCSPSSNKVDSSHVTLTDTAELVSRMAAAEKVSLSKPDSAIALYEGLINEIEALRPSFSNSCQLRMWVEEKRIMAIQGIAVSYTNLGDFDLAHKQISIGLDVVEKSSVDTCLKLQKVKERLLGSRSVVQKKQGNYLDAIETLRELLTLAEERKDISGRAIYLTNIGNAYQELGEQNLAIEYIGKAIKLHELTGNRKGVAVCKLTLANIYNSAGKFDEARSNYIETLTELTTLGYTGHVGLVQSNLGVLEKRQGNSKLARDCFDKALKNLTLTGNKSGVAMVWGNIADLANDTKNYSEAITYASLQLDEAKRASNLINQRYAYKHLYKANKGLNNQKEALSNYELFVTIKDSVASTEKQNEVARLEAKYQDVKKKEEIKHLEALSEVLQEKNRQKSTLIFVLGALAFSVMAAGGFWLRTIQLNSKRKALDLEQRLLRLQMNPHFFFNSLTTIQSMVLRDEKDKASDVVLSFARLMRLILESSREELIPISQEIEIVERYSLLQSLRHPNRFNLSVSIEPIAIREDLLIPPLLLQPFIENCIEHAFPSDVNGTIQLTISQINGSLIFTIEDNGIGFNTLEKSTGGQHKSLATQITRERLEIIKSKYKKDTALTIESPIDGERGTRVTIKIPEFFAF
jgi:tetratricopeptide (TPR) repeat protein